MPELTSFLALLDRALAVFGLIRGEELRRDERKRKAVAAFLEALSETRMYMARLAQGEDDDRETEAKLARLWNTAAVELRDVDHDLADRCMVKGQYWSDPRGWSMDEKEEARIKLDTVFQQARSLL